jgi:hypothetical protein
MDNQELHTQKVTILSRLIKESSLTLEEALLLLKEEETIEEDVVQEPMPKYTSQPGTWGNIGTGTTTPYTVTYPSFLSGFSSSGTLSTSSSTFTNTIADESADLNN